LSQRHLRDKALTCIQYDLPNPCKHSTYSQLPICRSNHPLDTSISLTHIQHIQQQFFQSLSNPSNPLTLSTGVHSSDINLSSFSKLLQFGQPIDDSIIQSFLTIMVANNPKTKVLDTNFSRDLINKGWEAAFYKYFLHSSSSRYAQRSQKKTTINTPIILIPFHIHDAHWVTITHRIIQNRVYFLYSDDMNSPNTKERIQVISHQYIPTQTFIHMILHGLTVPASHTPHTLMSVDPEHFSLLLYSVICPIMI
jgi:hypothetical protein